VDGLRVGGHGSLLESLGESGVGVAGAGNILGGGTVLDGKGSLGDHLTGTGTDDVNTENAVGLGIGDELDKTLSVEVGLGAGVGAEGERTDTVLDARCLDLSLVLANPGDLGVGVHDAGDGGVVDVAVAGLDVFDGGNGLLLGLVGQHGAESAVTNDTDVGELGAVFLVDDQTATVVLLDANLLEVQALGVGATANGDQDNVGVQDLLLAALGGLNVKSDGSTAIITGGDLGASLKLNTLLAQDLLSLLGDLGVHAGATDLAEELNNSDLSTETGPDGSLI
jgi:hypothetical protein